MKSGESRDQTDVRLQGRDAILNGTEIPFAYKASYILNFYREPLFRVIENELGLKRSEAILLLFLSFRDGVAAQEMCDLTGHSKTNVSRAVNALNKNGMITRDVDPGDNRRQLLYLTDLGRRAYSAFIPELMAREASMLAPLTKAERRQYMSLLTKIAGGVPGWTGKSDDLDASARRMRRRFVD